MLATMRPIISAAATLEEVAHCRAIPQPAERLNCFKSLKPGPRSKVKDAARAKAKQAAPAKVEQPAPAKTEQAAPSNTQTTTQTNAGEALISSTPDDPATTVSIDRLSFAPGQPICVDREARAGMILAGLLTSDPTKAATRGCQTIPDDAKLERLERSPSVFTFMRMIRVKVTSPMQPDLTSGFTIEMGR
jgi:hypothetical protein